VTKQSHLTVTMDMMKTLLLQAVTIMLVRGQHHVWSRPPHAWNSSGVHPFTGCSYGLRIQGVTDVNEDSTPSTIFLLFF
jgi:hypothetical protein